KPLVDGRAFGLQRGKGHRARCHRFSPRNAERRMQNAELKKKQVLFCVLRSAFCVLHSRFFTATPRSTCEYPPSRAAGRTARRRRRGATTTNPSNDCRCSRRGNRSPGSEGGERAQPTSRVSLLFRAPRLL